VSYFTLKEDIYEKAEVYCVALWKRWCCL